MMRRAAHLLGSLLILAAALWWVSLDAVLARLASADPVWLTVALLSLTVGTLSMAKRWQMTARALDLDIAYGAALREYYLALAINALVPGGVMGDVSRALRARRAGDLTRAVQSVMAERLLGQAALLLILIVGMLGTLAFPGAVNWPNATGWIVLAALLIAAATLFALAKSRLTADFARFCRALLLRPAITLHALLAAVTLVFALYACARATGTSPPLAAAATVLPLVLCAMLIPLSVGGWGWREGAAAALFPLFGASAEAGVATGICYGAAALVAALPGLAFVLSPTDTKPLADDA